MSVELTPAEKAAITRAKNKAAKEAAVAAASKVETAAEAIDDVTQTLNEAADSKFVQVTVSRVTPGIPSKVRNALYTAGIVLGAIATGAGPVVALFTGDAKFLATSVVGLSLALSNLLATLNLSKTETDIAKEN